MSQSPTATPPAPSAGAPGASAEASGWASTRSPAQIVDALRRAKRVLLLTHARPDGDALGSSLALARSLSSLGIVAMPAYVPSMPRWAAHLIAATPHVLLENDHAARLGALPEPDAMVIVDTGSWMQLEEVKGYLQPRTDKVMVIDHHLSGSTDLTNARLIDAKAAAVAEVVAPLCAQLLGVASAAKLPLDIAEPLFLGLATDTGWFKFSNTRSATLRLAADLLETGVDHSRLFEWVEQQDRPSRLALQARALASLEYFEGQSVAVMSLTRADFDATHSDSEEAGGFAADVLCVAEIQVAVVLTETVAKDPAGPVTKASIRSKPGPRAIDVAAVCRVLGGGGHARAAGVKIAAPIAEAKARIVQAIRTVKNA
ncbi:MAG: DHH family phosphoesterase [Phycisphaerales bacterium]